jgi:hypothetical protein
MQLNEEMGRGRDYYVVNLLSTRYVNTHFRGIPWEFFENVEVNAKKKKRSRCSLCGEQWSDIGVHLIAHGL